MLACGMEAMATGHYARTVNGRLCRGLDSDKDQSYFLCRLAAERLAQLILPLGSWRKEDVFAQAQAFGFNHFDGSESQDICFLAEQTLASFLAQQGLTDRSGDIVTADGKFLGRHQGCWRYTVGQRRGLGLPDATPWYVIALDEQRNQVIVGKNKDLLQREVLLTDLRWQIAELEQWQGHVQLRSRHQAAAAQVLPAEQGCWHVCFAEPQWAVTPGQFAVLYEKETVAGSGVIVPKNTLSVQRCFHTFKAC
jgi:tRNA-specific 2-thiouridylase